MALYTAPTVSGYNPSAPADDGSEVAANLASWASVKTELVDPINNYASDINSQTGAAFGKVFPNGVTTTTSGFTVAAGNRGKLYNVSGTSTVALLAAATASDGYAVGLFNNGTGIVTVDPDGSETVNGETTTDLPPGYSIILVSDGSNWAGIKAGQEWQRLQSDVAPSATANQDFSWGTGVKDIRLIWRTVAPSTDNANFALQLSQSASVVTTTSYRFHLTNPSDGASTYAGLGDATADEILITGNVGSASNEVTSGELTIRDVQGTGTHILYWTGVAVNGAGVVFRADGSGRLTTTGALDGARLKFSAGNIASGTIELWGRY